MVHMRADTRNVQESYYGTRYTVYCSGVEWSHKRTDARVL